MSGNIVFSVINGTTLQINILGLDNTTDTIFVELAIGMKPRTPIEILKELQDKLSYKFLFQDGKTLDQVVTNVMTVINPKYVSLSMTDNTVSSIKSRAKAYYQMWINKDKTDIVINNTEENRQTANIVIELLAWWFIRRLVHVYVVCAIIDEVYKSGKQSSQLSTTQIQPTTTFRDYTKDDGFDKLKQKYDSDVAFLQSEQAQLSGDLKSLINKHTQLEQEYTKLYDNGLEKDNKITELEHRLDDFKKLLLHSSSMIFRMEEVPNMIKYN
jgi:hypothetical protein